MSPRRLIFVFIALLASGATIFFGQAWLNAQRGAVVAEAPPAPAPIPQPTRKVLVAAGPLSVGQFIRPENLRWQSWPDGNAPASYIMSDQHQLEDYVGAVVRTGLGDGEPLTDARVVRPGDRGFLAAVLTPGDRAVTVTLTPSSGDAGFVFPGDHVDLIVSMTLTDDEDGNDKGGNRAKEHHASETVLTDVRILALDQRVDDEKKEVIVAKTATLEVTPKQAEIVAVVSEIGRLSLSLRSLAHDETEAAGESANSGLSYTFDSDATQLIRPPNFRRSMQRVSVWRADKETQMEFPRSVR